MDTTKLKKFAQAARSSLLEQVEAKLKLVTQDDSAAHREHPAAVKKLDVHHLVQLADIAKDYKVDPIKDLRPVCPNCHSMLHQHRPPLSIDDLKRIIGRS